VVSFLEFTVRMRTEERYKIRYKQYDSPVLIQEKHCLCGMINNVRYYSGMIERETLEYDTSIQEKHCRTLTLCFYNVYTLTLITLIDHSLL
jgi:hypothetical protein